MRKAVIADAELIAEQRRQMFFDAGHAHIQTMPHFLENFKAWVQARLADGSYLGWLAMTEGKVVGGAGLWVMDFPPHFLDAEPRRGYLLNFYVDPAMRGQGTAGRLVELTLAESRRLGIKAVTLHASRFGKPIYERYGFAPTNEMMLRLEPS